MSLNRYITTAAVSVPAGSRERQDQSPVVSIRWDESLA